jgi:CubicO group peptidase (beta-lactamase class C family)
MIRRPSSLLFFGLLTVAQTLPGAQQQTLRAAETTDDIVSDLERYIPSYLKNEDIPGAGIALIQNGTLVWSEGFGIANAVTREPVTSETLFEVASISKVVTAYIALRLVDEGVLSLDEPLDSYLSESWLPPSPYREVITLRHALTHTSGLGHNTLGRENLFPPGARYSYSGIALQYVQAVIEHVTGKTLEDVAREKVFEPLGMSSSTFVNRADLTGRTANGHLRAQVTAFLFALAFLVSLIVVGSIGLVIQRFRTGRWRPTRQAGLTILAFVFVLCLVPVFWLFGAIGFVEFAWLIGACGFVLLCAFLGAFFLGGMLIKHLAVPHRWQHGALLSVWSVLTIVVLGAATTTVHNLPVPRWPDAEELGSSSLRTTVANLAAFLIELSDPRHLSPEMSAEMRSPQVRLSDGLSWGLGPGLQHSEDGNALWHWGQHVDFQTMMIIYPKQGFGVVVCTNNDFFSPDVARDIAHRALGGEIDPICRGMRLEYNYQGNEGS